MNAPSRGHKPAWGAPYSLCLQSAQALYTQGQPSPAGQSWLLKTPRQPRYWEVQAQAPVNQAPLWIEGLLQDSWVWNWDVVPAGKLNLDLERHKVSLMSFPWEAAPDSSLWVIFKTLQKASS